MYYKKRYIQYNDLVFDEVDMVEETSFSVSTKSFDAEYGFTHGAYSPHKQNSVLFRPASVSMSLTFKLKKLPCGERPFYIRFAKNELAKPGKLWAVQDNTLIWAHAYLESIYEADMFRRDEYVVDINFTLPEGVWHKADKLKTYLKPYDVCDFMECHPLHDNNPCKEDCCDCPPEPAEDCLCDCDCVEREDALCFHRDLSEMYDPCGGGYRVVYSCIAANKYFGDFLLDDRLGQKFCNTACEFEVVGQLYSNTELPTEGIKITLHADSMHDPYIEINGNGNIIKGDYEGVLVIHPDGSVYNHPNYDCICPDPLPVDVWQVPAGHNYGWSVEQGNNRFIVDIGTCCPVCAWVEIDELSY